MELNVIRQQYANKNILPNQLLSSYDKLVSFVHDPRFIRVSPSDSVRTTELTAAFNNTMQEHIASKTVFPKLMNKLIDDYPKFSITKKVKNYGTIYQGIGLTTDPIPQEGKAVPIQRQTNDKYLCLDRNFLKERQNAICKQCGWTDNQYKQMGALGIIHINRELNITATIYVIFGRLTEYIGNEILKLKRKIRYAKSIKVDFEKSTDYDKTLFEDDDTPIYTNRLKVATLTYDAGQKLQKSLNSYIDRINAIPKLDIIDYINTTEVDELIKWLKDNSMCKTRIDMAKQQQVANPDPPQYVNWTVEGEIKYHIVDTQQEVDD